MRRWFIISFIFCYCFLSSSLYAQKTNYNEIKITYNHIVDAANQDTQEVMRLFETYIKEKTRKEKTQQYWCKNATQNHEVFDFLEKEFKPSLYMGYGVHVLSIKNKNGLYTIKAQFSFCQNDGTPYVLAIVNYIATKENGHYLLDNILTYNRKHWECQTIGYIDFYYPKYHVFNTEKANDLNKFIKEITHNLKVTPKYFEYYFADDYDEVQKLKGIDYYIGMGGFVKPSGIALDNKVYCGGLGENYRHEVYHIQIDEHYPNTHYWVTEGMAVFVSDASRGKSLHWHLKRLHAYLTKTPELNLNNMLDYSNYDEYTDYHYALGGLIMQRIHEKGGWELVMKMLNSGTHKEDYYNAIEKYLGVKRQNLNTFIRNEIRLFLNL